MSIETELLALKNPDGLILVETAHDWAKQNPDSALHGSLEWNNERAGYEYRLSQIRRLISLHIRSEDGGPRLISLSVDRQRPGGGYRDMNDIIADRDRTLFEVALQDALNELERLKKKYERLKVLEPVWDAVSHVSRGRKRKGGGGAERSRGAS